MGVGGGQYKYKLVLVGLFALTGGRGWCCLHHSLCTVVEGENIIMLYGGGGGEGERGEVPATGPPTAEETQWGGGGQGVN